MPGPWKKPDAVPTLYAELSNSNIDTKNYAFEVVGRFGCISDPKGYVLGRFQVKGKTPVRPCAGGGGGGRGRSG